MKKVVLASAAIGFVVWMVVRDQRKSSRALSWSTRQRLSGRLDQVRGTAKQAAGRLTGDPSLTAQGLIDQAVGAIKRGVGKTVDSAKDAIHA
jgi:uncharacterized protein YjbJ (UPF0337 family)